MIDPLVRRAVATHDAESLRDLEGEARASLVDARGGQRWLATHPQIGPEWADVVETRIVFVADLVDASDPCSPVLVVGYLLLDVDGDIAHVDQVFVTPEARQLGFGDALLVAARDEARRLGALVLEGHALPGDRETKNLYERAGITARLITVSTSLG